MLSEKIYCILFGIVLFIIIYQLKLTEGFATTRCLIVYTKDPNSSYKVRYYQIPSNGILNVGNISTINNDITSVMVPAGYLVRFYASYNGSDYSRTKNKNNIIIGNNRNQSLLNQVRGGGNEYYSFTLQKVPMLSYRATTNKFNYSGQTSRPSNSLEIRTTTGLTRYYPLSTSKNSSYSVGYVGTSLNDKFKYFRLPVGYVVTFHQHSTTDTNFNRGWKYAYVGTGGLRLAPQGTSSFIVKKIDFDSKVNYSKINAGLSSCSGSTAQPQTVTGTNTQSRTVYRQSNCSAYTNQSKSLRSLYQQELLKKKQLESNLNKIRQEQRECQASINNSARNMTDEQKAALIAAQKQLQTTQNVLKDAQAAYNKTKQALSHQTRANYIMKQDQNQSIKSLQEANERVDAANQKFAKKQDHEFKLVNISPVDEEPFCDMNYPTISVWQNEWKKDLE